MESVKKSKLMESIKEDALFVAKEIQNNDEFTLNDIKNIRDIAEKVAERLKSLFIAMGKL